MSEGGYQALAVFPQLNFAQMLGLVPIPGDGDHAVLLTKDGMIRRADLADDAAAPETFLDIRDRIIRNPGTEEGLLGLAFAPDYASSGRFYVYFSAGDPRRAVISRFTAHDQRADAASEEVLLEIGEPFANHNGGALAFGSDGDLYIGVGDGGSQHDPSGNGQNKDVLLGKILRIDVSGAAYSSPPDNPFVLEGTLIPRPGGEGGRPEVYAYGMRNPWRINFDPATGALWAGDVGQNTWEEVDEIDIGGNYGWNIMEGNHCHKPEDGCDTSGLLRPVAEYSHDFGCSITGGFVYRGKEMPELDGWYLYSDYCSGRVWAVDTGNDSAPIQIADTKLSVSSFAQDNARELYLVTFDKKIAKLARR